MARLKPINVRTVIALVIIGVLSYLALKLNAVLKGVM